MRFLISWKKSRYILRQLEAKVKPLVAFLCGFPALSVGCICVLGFTIGSIFVLRLFWLAKAIWFDKAELNSMLSTNNFAFKK